MKNQIKKVIQDSLNSQLYRNKAKISASAFFEELKDMELPSLSESEKKKIDKKWSDLPVNVELGFSAYRVFKMFCGFNENFVPECYFYPYILRSLNPTNNYISLTHKGLLSNLFNGLPTVKSILYKFNSNITDTDYLPVENEEIGEILKSHLGEWVLKPTQDSNSGHGITFYSPAQIDVLKNEFLQISGSWVIQESLRQSKFTAQFNPSSLNTFRIESLYINGRCSICAVVLKIGGENKRVDNGANGSTWVGVKSDGRLEDVGWYISGKMITKRNGINFKGKIVPNFDQLCEFVKQCHYRVPSVGFVGWDIGLDAKNHPVIVEANMWWPSVSYPQLCCKKPIFGDRTTEVIEYVRLNPVENVCGFRRI